MDSLKLYEVVVNRLLLAVNGLRLKYKVFAKRSPAKENNKRLQVESNDIIKAENITFKGPTTIKIVNVYSADTTPLQSSQV